MPLGMGNALLVHSGGPTAVINSSLYGAVSTWCSHSTQKFYGARFGIDGVLNEHFINLSAATNASLSAIAQSPASALGTSRREVKAADLERVIRILRDRDIRFFFYTGGNGSMGTAREISRAALDAHYELQIIGIPKTIDNDLLETHHTPGYGSAARFFAHALRDIGADNQSLPGQVEIVEVLGRNAGWIVAATALARNRPDDAPHLIYFPELRLPLEKLLQDINAVFQKLGRCVVAVCEGQLDEHGEPFGADVRSGSRGSLAMNLAHRLAMLVSERLKLRARSEKPGLLGRSSSIYTSDRDRKDAELCGTAAVKAAFEGATGVMVTLGQDPGETGLASLEKVAFHERLYPAEWRTVDLNDVTEDFLRYAQPLIGPVAPHQGFQNVEGI